MEFWMAEIERMEQQNDLERVQQGLSPRHKNEAEQIDIADLEKADPRSLIFVPEDWMQDFDKKDNAFESI